MADTNHLAQPNCLKTRLLAGLLEKITKQELSDYQLVTAQSCKPVGMG
jgi:hypothetical protein